MSIDSEAHRRDLREQIEETEDEDEQVDLLQELEQSYVDDMMWTRAERVHDIYREMMTEEEYRDLWTPISDAVEESKRTELEYTYTKQTDGSTCVWVFTEERDLYGLGTVILNCSPERAEELMEGDGITINLWDKVVAVDSESVEDKKYVIEFASGGFLEYCTCPHHQHRNAWCKHMEEVESRMQTLSMISEGVSVS